MDYVYGIRCHDSRNNLKYDLNGNLIYPTAGIGVVFDYKNNSQKFFLDHNDDVTCLDANDNTVVTG